MPLSDADRRPLLDAVASHATPYPSDRFRGRGIVICAGGARYFPCVWVNIRVLRHLGCQLPIELWHLGPEEMSDEMKDLVTPYGVKCVDGNEVRKAFPVRTLNGWELKAFSMLHSSFEEVLLLDADNVPVVDPEFLFDEPEYLRTGAVFWPDFGKLQYHRPIWDICGVPFRSEPEFESGQIVVRKSQCWHALNVAMHFNEHSDYYYRFIHGDKDTFHMAWHRVGQEYSMPDFPIYALPGTMCQHDFNGRRIFQHRNLKKWKLDEENERIPGFQLEDECLAFLNQLKRVWWQSPDGIRYYQTELSSESERNAAKDIIGGRWLYRRVGYDEREFTFALDGRIELGSESCERFWDIRCVEEGDAVLDVFGETEWTFRARKSEDGVWRGHWRRHERMPVELIPLGKFST